MAVVTMLMRDASAKLGAAAKEALEQGRLADLLYAGDTLVFEVCGAHVDGVAIASESVGASLGMSLHSGKHKL